MKKGILFALSICMVMFFPCGVQAKQDVQGNGALLGQAKAVYLMDDSTGKVIYAKNEKKRLYPASMTKMMGLLLIFEALHKKAITWNENVTTSALAASMGGSQVYLKVGETMSVRDMVKSICIASANDAMVAMGEKIGGSNGHFVEMMNDKAKQLHLINTHFMNATGLHDPDHYTCAQDMGTIAQALIKEGKGELLALTSTYDAYIRENTDAKFWLVNTNKLLKQYQGVDGLKTGFTSEALSCITVSAKRQGLRLIAVVMGAPDSKIRNRIAMNLLDYGFSQYTQSLLYKKGTRIAQQRFENGKPQVGDMITLAPVSYAYQKGTKPTIKRKQIQIDKKALPYKKGEKIGVVHIVMSDGYTMDIPIGVNKTIQPLDFIDIYVKAWMDVFA